MLQRSCVTTATLLTLFAGTAAAQHRYFELRVVDEASRPVPCVELYTTSSIVLRTDANGTAAFYEADLMGRLVWFGIRGSHIEAPRDGFGIAGVRYIAAEGASQTIVVRRTSEPACEADDRETRRIARGVPSAADLMRVDVVDTESGRGVPLVRLRCGDHEQWGDSAGRFAIDPIDLSGSVDLELWSYGYQIDALHLDVRAGGSAMAMAARLFPAERLYRITGAGIYRDSLLLGAELPIDPNRLARAVLGQDGVFTARYRGQLYWTWGDTVLASYAIGNLLGSGARSDLPSMGGLDPERGIAFDYFASSEGEARAMAPTETVTGAGAAWLAGLIAVPDRDGEERLHSVFGKVLPDFTVTRTGMLTFDDSTGRFVPGVDFSDRTARWPLEGAFLVDQSDQRWVYYHNPVRIPARSEALLDPSTYETFTPFTDRSGTVERSGGVAVYRWRGGGIPYPTNEPALTARDRIEGHLVDVETAQAIPVHQNGSTVYNDYTGRYIRYVQAYFASGETWLAMADTPMGPWVYAAHVASFPGYTFYNPRAHPEFDRDFGRRVLFEGTYTQAISPAPIATPRYDYNQIMHAIDLDRPELALPVAIYESERGELGPANVTRPGDAPIVPSFFAPIARRPHTVPVWWSGAACEERRLMIGGEPLTPPIFYALPTDTVMGSEHVVLYEVERDRDSPRYTVHREPGAVAIAIVWRNTVEVALPVGDYRPALIADAGPDRCASGPLDLSEGDWKLDGSPVGGRVSLTPGLHVLTRIARRADGFAVEDHALLRVPIPPTCSIGFGRTPPPWLLLAVIGLALVRRRLL
jgi:hypothetical protein